jgi:hypothetical protein
MTSTAQSPSRWQKLLAWFRAVDQALDYDPQAQNRASIKQLSEAVTELNVRLDAAERRG